MFSGGRSELVPRSNLMGPHILLISIYTNNDFHRCKTKLSHISLNVYVILLKWNVSLRIGGFVPKPDDIGIKHVPVLRKLILTIFVPWFTLYFIYWSIFNISQRNKMVMPFLGILRFGAKNIWNPSSSIFPV